MIGFRPALDPITGIPDLNDRIAYLTFTGNTLAPVSILVKGKGVVTAASVNLAIQDVVNDVNNLVSSAAISQGTGNDLGATLKNIIDDVNNRKLDPAVNKVQALLKKLDALSKSEKLTSAQAGELKGQAGFLLILLKNFTGP